MQIGAQAFPLGQSAAIRQIALADAGEVGAALSVPADALADFPKVTRRPYLHFIVDRSQGSVLEGPALRAALVRLAQQFPAAQEYAITAANFDAADLTNGIRPLATLATWDPQRLASLPRRGGFAQDRALKRVLLQSANDLGTAAADALGRFPIPVIVRSSRSEPIMEADLEAFGKFAPDAGGYFTSIDGARLTSHAWAATQGAAPFTPATPARPVVLFKLGKSLAPALAEDFAPRLLPLLQGAGELQMWNAARGAWENAPHAQLSPASRYGAGIRAWLRQEALLQEPAKGKAAWREVVAASRESGIIVPATSYIVVENSAQWRKLEETEKRS